MKSTSIALIALTLFLSLSIQSKRVSAQASSQEVCADFGSKAAGESLNGLGAVHPLLNISSTNNTVAVKEFIYPVAYGANTAGVQNVVNACIGSGGFADVGSGNYTPDTKLHDYVFTFAAGT